jgi:hypothetical protein
MAHTADIPTEYLIRPSLFHFFPMDHNTTITRPGDGICPRRGDKPYNDRGQIGRQDNSTCEAKHCLAQFCAQQLKLEQIR